MSTSACLVTSTPEFQEPAQTRPVLVAATADPSTRNVVVIDEAVASSNIVTFKAALVPPENDAIVHFKLYLDYGKQDPNRPERPFLFAIDDFVNRYDPASPPQNHTITGEWIPKSPDFGYGCHTITLIATHAFDDATDCPTCRNDSSQLTWQVYRCDSSGASGPPCMPIDLSSCQGWTDTCPAATGDAGACGDAP